MIKKTVIFAVLISCVFIQAAWSQESHPDWEKYLEQFEDVTEQSQIMEQLEDWLKNPLDLNSASLQELLTIPGFPENGAKAIASYRQKNGEIPSLDIARNLVTEDEELWNWLSQFITVRPPKTPLQWQLNGRIRLSQYSEKSRGYEEKEFTGNPAKIYQRYRVSVPGKIQAATLFEKDCGEISLHDHHVFNLEYQLQKPQTKIILGDYTVNIGYGLLLWSPFSVSKGGAPFYAAHHYDRLFRPYLSSFEANYFRGLAIHAQIANWDFACWYSKLRQDARITDVNQISSFAETGLHRSASERETQDRAIIESRGGLIGTTWRGNFTIQLSAMQVKFNPEIMQGNDEPKEFQLYGGKIRVGGVNCSFQWQGFNLFFEAAKQENQGQAILTGVTGDWKKTKLLILHRDYSPTYQNPYSKGFGEGSTTNNETGWYSAWQFSPARHAKLTLAADQFRSLWKTYTTSLPQAGSDFFLKWEQRLQTTFYFYLQYGYDQKETTILHPYADYYCRELAIPEVRQRLRLHFRLVVQKDFEVNSRLETTQSYLQPEFGQPNQKKNGWLIFWDFRKRFSPVYALTRITFFDTPAYETRIYQFENDLPGVLTSKLLYGRGLRFYFLIHCQPFSGLQISVKYASTRYEDKSTIGSGWDLINSPVEHYLSAGLDWEF